MIKFAFLILLTSCAYVHHVQIGDIDNSRGEIMKPFELAVSETGVSFQEAGGIAKALTRDKNFGNDMQDLANIIALFQMGPKTGKPVFNDSYADSIIHDIYDKCPSGKITGLTIVREMNSYPVVSGEIVKIRAYCLMKRTARKSSKRKS